MAEPPTYGSNLPASEYSMEGIRFLRTSDISPAGLIHDESPVFIDPALIDKRQVLSTGDLLISRSGTIGRATLYELQKGPCTFAGYLVRLRLRERVDPRFAWYVTQSTVFSSAISQESIQSTIGNFNAQKMSEIRIPYPELEEQLAIVRFLDDETAKIDALVEKNRTLVETVAVRLQHDQRGLLVGGVGKHDLGASGVEWIGELPTHWVVRRLGTLFFERDERGGPELPQLLVSLRKGVILREFADDRIERVAADLGNQKIARKGDLVFNKMRMWQGPWASPR